MKDSQGIHSSIYGDRLKKVFRFDRDMETFESDVVPEIRTLVDLYYDSDDNVLDDSIDDIVHCPLNTRDFEWNIPRIHRCLRLLSRSRAGRRGTARSRCRCAGPESR